MSETVRTFIALPIMPTGRLRSILRQLRELGGPLKVFAPEQLHLTLSFLGDTSWNRIAEVSEVISSVAEHHEAFHLTLGDIGAFPGTKRPRVIWTDVVPHMPVEKFAGELSEALEQIGFPSEGRAFRPHVTIARVKGRPPQTLFSFLESHRDEDFGVITIDECFLYQSELTPRGPHYTVMSSHKLSRN